MTYCSKQKSRRGWKGGQRGPAADARPLSATFSGFFEESLAPARIVAFLGTYCSINRVAGGLSVQIQGKDMAMSIAHLEPTDQNAAFVRGRRHGLAIAALLLSLVSFVSLLGAEKAITAIALAALAIKGAEAGTLPRKLGAAAI